MIESIDEIARSLHRAELDLIESDARALGITESTAHEYEIVHQDHDGQTVYRGIRRDGIWLWDRHPEFGRIREGQAE